MTPESEASSNEPEESGAMFVDETSSEEFIELDKQSRQEANETLQRLQVLLGLNPIDQTQMRSIKYQTEALEKLDERLRETLFTSAVRTTATASMIDQLVEKFNQTSNREMKIKILSVLPKEWTREQIRNVFGESATNYMIIQTKELVKQQGILCDTMGRNPSKSKHFIIQMESVDLVLVCATMWNSKKMVRNVELNVA